MTYPVRTFITNLVHPNREESKYRTLKATMADADALILTALQQSDWCVSQQQQLLFLFITVIIVVFH